MVQQSKAGASKTEKISSYSADSPSINLPKGGGAIHGIGEKFAANPVTGTGSMTVPIATSPGRSGFGPELSLSYDSGAGNGAFGFGWFLSLPSITRKTDKGLPQYHDAEDSDVFVLSGAEDLIPVLEKKNSKWQRQVLPQRTVDGKKYDIHRYRPRIEGLFARIERWSNVNDPADVHWRSISKDNVLTLYGKNANFRIFDPNDPSRIFSWLICETRDDKGNCILYEYKPEDGNGVDLSRAHEHNRGDVNDARRSVNRYLKHIRYGNRTPMLDDQGRRPVFLTEAQIENAGWMFQVVFDYGEHNPDAPMPDDTGDWGFRVDPFSFYRSTFEIRTTRLCQRVLMFHHFPGESGVGKDCLVHSTDFTYSYEQEPTNARNPIYTFLCEVTQNGYKRNNDGYLKRSLPPVEFGYTRPEVQDTVEEVNPESLENLPAGLDGATWQWTDLHGEGIPGILTEQADAWFYKRNLSPVSGKSDDGQERIEVRFTALETVAVKPNLALAAGAQFMDLAGDGQHDLIILEGPEPGLYEHDDAEGWQSFRPFTSRLNRHLHDPNTKLIDLTGDGLADVLITEHQAFVWHASLAEDGFGFAQRVAQTLDEERGPRLVFADGTQSIFTADLSGDGLSDLVRIRNGEVCYWPNLGYARFGAKVTMDNAPWFEQPNQFDHKRIRLADIDGSGTTDIIYLHGDGVRLYFNQSGNSWSMPQVLKVFPRVDDLVKVMPVDLLGNGTACLVWSSPLPVDMTRPMRYVNLMGGQKPHLLVKTVNNLGAETRVQYAPSTKFYLQDKIAGKPWITKLPFPVHVVERVETYDHISRNRFVTRYEYHHGYFDGVEREFRGFGMVEQFDTETIAALTESSEFPVGENIHQASHVPPVHTKTWFHTGTYIDRQRISHLYAKEYYGAPKPGEDGYETRLDKFIGQQLLPDTILPPGLTIKEEREACRALKGSMLRQEVYADDAGLDSTPKQIERAQTPYTVTEQNFTIQRLQPKAGNRHAVFFTHAREAINYYYERDPSDPRISHAIILEVDTFGNVLKEAAIGYGRLQPDLKLSPDDQVKQAQTHITYTENKVTNAVQEQDAYRTPLPAETVTWHLTGETLDTRTQRFSFDEWAQDNFALPVSATEIPYQQAADSTAIQKRPIEHIRSYYRPDDFGTSNNDPLTRLPLGSVENLALPGESYKLAFTPGLLSSVFQRPRDGQPDEELLLDLGNILPADINAGNIADRGGYVDLDGDNHWWIPSGPMFFSPMTEASPIQEVAFAREHFFLLHRYRDPFGMQTEVSYDAYNLLTTKTRDALNNRVTSENDYRVLQPFRVTDPNRNRTEVSFDVIGMVVGTAIMGKAAAEPVEGDSLEGFNPNLSDAQIQAHLDNPLADPHAILNRATTRLVYDLFAYQRTKDQPNPQAAVVCTLARETHDADLKAGKQTRIQLSLSYSDGFGREIQKKIQAEPGPVPERDTQGKIIVGDDGQPVMTNMPQNPRWVGSGWTVFNNKGKPVRQYEPFFTDTHRFEFDVRIGVSPVIFYDPAQRVVATLHPNHTWEKFVFDPWWQETWDVNDTLLHNPRDDADVGEYFRHLDEAEYLPTWYEQRQAGDMGVHERQAAEKTALHADTPTIAHADSLGRTFLTIAHNRYQFSNAPAGDAPQEEHYNTRIVFDIEGNQRKVIDAKDRVVMRYDYDMLGNRIHQASMEAGERWMLNDITGKPIRAWDSRQHQFRTTYDELRRPVGSFLTDTEFTDALVEQTTYGESQPNPQEHNLRGQVIEHRDQAGVVKSEDYDFKGNLKRSERTLAATVTRSGTVIPAYKTTVDWSGTVGLENENYTSTTRYDALNRPIELVSPDNSIVRPGYNEANLLESISANLKGAAVTTSFVDNIDYDAKGQRLQIDYGNGASTEYHYDRLTFRLIHMQTRRIAADFPDDCPQPTRTGWPGCQIQNLSYTYDPVGNITHIQDDAQQTLFFRNKRVEPSNNYLYDAVYRLIEATGREHLGQVGGTPIPHSHNDAPCVGLLHPGDGNAMGTYRERYDYDAVGNFLQMQHRGTDPNHPGWTRGYTYNENSLLEPVKHSNRLSSTTVGNGNVITESYSYDAHGNMTSMPHLSLMQWDYRDQLQATARQVNNGGDSEITYYVYDSSGQRVRKITELANANGSLKDERIYLGGYEVYRKHYGDLAGLVRESLHIMDSKQRIALIETRNDVDDGISKELISYQLGNHLGTVSLELNGRAQTISYEEYSPYGSTVYQAVNKSIKSVAKRYRYTGKERDKESGLHYYGARYYATWLGRWIATDPAGFIDGVDMYYSMKSNPLRNRDNEGMASVDAQLDDVVRYKDKVKNKDALGQNVQKDHIIAQGKKKQYRTDPTGKVNFSPRKELTVVTETGAATPTTSEKPHTRKTKNDVSEIKRLNKQGIKSYSGDIINPSRTAAIESGMKATSVDEAILDQMDKDFLSQDLQDTGKDIKAMDEGTFKGETRSNRKELDRLAERRSNKKFVEKGPPVDPDTGKVLDPVPKLNTKVKVPASVPVPASVARKGLSDIVEVAAKRGGRLVPGLGTAGGVYAVTDELVQGNFRRAGLEAIGASEIPFVSQTADAALLVEDVGWVAKDVIDPEQKLEQWVHNNAPSWMGF